MGISYFHTQAPECTLKEHEFVQSLNPEGWHPIFVEYSMWVWPLRTLLQCPIGLEAWVARFKSLESLHVFSPDAFAEHNLEESNRSFTFSSHSWNYKNQ